jgi:hypothetical protein
VSIIGKRNQRRTPGMHTNGRETSGCNNEQAEIASWVRKSFEFRVGGPVVGVSVLGFRAPSVMSCRLTKGSCTLNVKLSMILPVVCFILHKIHKILHTAPNI